MFRMRLRTLAAALALCAGCATRAQPYRFASPLLGAADVPAAELPGVARTSAKPVAKRRANPVRVAGGWQVDAQQGAIREVSARGLEARLPTASAEAADAVTQQGAARAVVWSRLPAPHRGSSLPAQPGGITSAITIPNIREPSDLRGLVGQRDTRDPYAIAIGWLADIGIDIHPPATGGEHLVTWAQTAGMLAPATDVAKPGDLLVFDHAVGDDSFDLVALAIARDARGVTEFVYAGGGVIRRGFLDPAHASSRRDLDGNILNTFLRHVRRMPPNGTRYLAGELLSHVIHTH
jgi:hypothetical protein